jgi:hypothetical protein
MSSSARMGLLWTLVSAAALGQEPAPVRPAIDSSVVEYIEQLRDEGINVIYSDQLLSDDVRVQESSAEGGPLDRLRVVLSPYGLALAPGPRGTWLVVRAARTEAPDSRPAAAFDPSPPAIENVVVTASRYAFGRATAPSTRQLSARNSRRFRRWATMRCEQRTCCREWRAAAFRRASTSAAGRPTSRCC